jgi:glyoxylase-like metal-dependent hydrolase (beta-lactamase superfamily II)
MTAADVTAPFDAVVEYPDRTVNPPAVRLGDMAIGDVSAVTVGDCTDLSFVDTGMYDTEAYGAVYLIDDDRPALVDTGIGTNHERVLDLVEEAGLDPEDIEVIALTHVHLDHAGGAGFLVEQCPNADVYVHSIGAPHVADPERLWAGTKSAVGDQIDFYTEPEPVPEERIVEIEGGDSIDLGDHALDVYHAPGHAPHQVVFHDPENDAVFTADAAGIYAPSREEVFPTSPPPNFDPEGCRTDIDTLREIDPEVLCYAHFGPAEASDKLDRYADVLDSWVEAVAAKRAELDDDAVIDHFVAEADAERAVWGATKADAEVAMNVRGVLTALDRGA